MKKMLSRFDKLLKEAPSPWREKQRNQLFETICFGNQVISGKGEFAVNLVVAARASAKQEPHGVMNKSPREGSPRPSCMAPLADSAKLDVYYTFTLVKTANKGSAKMDRQPAFFSSFNCIGC